MYVLNIASTIKKMSVNDVSKRCQSMMYKKMSAPLSLKTILHKLNFLRKNGYYLLLLANRLIEKIPNPQNAKEHYQSFIRKT